MIVEFLLGAFTGVVTFILNILPEIPSFPSQVDDSVEWFLDLILQPFGLLTYLYTAPILTFLFVMLLAILFFDNIYSFVLWVYHKIRG